MKKLTRKLFLFILTICMLMVVGCSKPMIDDFKDLTLNQNTPMELKYVTVTPEYESFPDETGYYTSITLNVSVKGYEQLSYFNAVVLATFSATIVTDDSPSGEAIAFTVRVSLDNNGNGQMTVIEDIVACRFINSVTWAQEVEGSVTKIKAERPIF